MAATASPTHSTLPAASLAEPKALLSKVRQLDVLSEVDTLGDQAAAVDSHDSRDAGEPVPEETRNPVFAFLRKKRVPVASEKIDLIELGTSGLALQSATLRLLTSLIPAWSPVTDPSHVHLHRLSGALTNCVFIVSYAPGETHSATFAHPPHVIFRVYGLGVDRFIRRERELVFMVRLSRSGVGPKLLGCFLNGRFEEYVESHTLTAAEMRRDDVACMVAKELCRFNRLGPVKAGGVSKGAGCPEPPSPVANDEDIPHAHSRSRTESSYSPSFSSASHSAPLADDADARSQLGSPAATLAGDDLAASLATGGLVSALEPVRNASPVDASDDERTHSPETEDEESEDEDVSPEIWDRVDKWYALSLNAVKELEASEDETVRAKVAGIGMEQYGEELQRLRERLDKVESPVVFGHNDLQYGNILRRTDGTLLFVDYEYAGYTYRGADIANHFCEWAADYHTSQPHDLAYLTKYPTPTEQRLFVSSYLDAWANLTASPRPEGEEREKMVEDVVREAEEYAQLAHLHWGFWGVLQALDNPYSGTPGDFDYLEYAVQRFKEYERKKALMATL
ncbi:kinase-like protein [Gonapodya prolifera JEL478]|uniref:Kinase-like protein n=1 Tax=Gonapodya prolifera (strain JEL478) TaxID=1344416 RepID=A0A139API8_GONPJ|nr:kinase-like protein [Gonapodya prolifera JEL478]|eukprot:KXS18656.1 kinase-like protein [Gonapodya prolifera JEL478]